MSKSTIEIQALETQEPAEKLFGLIGDMPSPVWLDSSSLEGGRYHLISAAPERELRADEATHEQAASLFRDAQTLLETFPKLNSMPGIPFQGGLIGYLSYELGAVNLGVRRSEQAPMPAGFLGLYLWALVIDNLNQSRQLVFHPACHPETKDMVLARFFGRGSKPKSSVDTFSLETPFSPSTSKQAYVSDLKQIDEYVHAGDVYQVNYAQHFSATYQGDTFDAYVQLRRFAPAPYSGYLKLGDNALLCHSPEQFIEIKGRHVRTSPIKGTAPRSGDERMDQRNADVLVSSEKDRAENLMIVDLMRNDLGKLCVSGSIQTSKLFELKSYSNVHHLVSEIVGELNPESTALDLLSASIPAGSITGAPKKRAVEIIRELESQQRSFYCGNLGYISLCGNTDFNIGIRSLVADGKEIHCWGGGGIVADSNAAKEYEETLHKVGGLMSELEARFLETTKPNKTSA